MDYASLFGAALTRASAAHALGETTAPDPVWVGFPDQEPPPELTDIRVPDVERPFRVTGGVR